MTECGALSWIVAETASVTCCSKLHNSQRIIYSPRIQRARKPSSSGRSKTTRELIAIGDAARRGGHKITDSNSPARLSSCEDLMETTVGGHLYGRSETHLTMGVEPQLGVRGNAAPTALIYSVWLSVDTRTVRYRKLRHADGAFRRSPLSEVSLPRSQRRLWGNGA